MKHNMEGQLNLFSNDFEIIDGGGIEEKDKLKCFESELKSVNYLTLNELFSGYNSIKAITFSYDARFINDIMDYFDYGEIILGADFLVQKDNNIQEFIAEVLTNASEATKMIKKYNRLADMLKNGNIEFKTPTFILDHRKIYILKSDNGKTRVIKTSANMSYQAWSSDHMEHYEYDDTLECYNEYIKDFETMWDMSELITADIISSKMKDDSDDIISNNPLLKKVKETGNTIVFKQAEDDISIDNIKYTVDHDKIKEKYKAIIDGIASKKDKNGIVKIIPDMIKKFEINQKKLFQKKIKINNISEEYPSLKFNLIEKTAFLNDVPINLSPSESEIRSDLDELISMYNNYNQFVSSNTVKLQASLFKFMNAIFCSPFNAAFRCACKFKGIPVSSLPMFALISSETSNSGKTFIVKAALKMMTGKELDGVKACDYPKENIKNVQVGIKGIPFFIDEIDKSYLARIKDIIKNPEKCEDNQLENMPMLIFASNDIDKPDEPIRKRMMFFPVDGALPSTVDKTAYESKGKMIIKKLGTGFYREYLSRMIDAVKKEMDFIMYSNEISDEYYPDLMAISSNVFISILEDYNYELPSYITKLTWENNYSSDSNAEEIIEEIGRFYKNNKKACTFTKEEIIIELGNDKNSKKQLESWKNMLPAEMKPTLQNGRDYSKIIINKIELEKRLGYKLKKNFFIKG